MIRAVLSAPLGRYHTLAGCLFVVAVYAILFQVMAHTRLIEKVMAMTCSRWEFLLILGFLVSRILTYLVIPPFLAALGVYALLARNPEGDDDWSEEYGEGRGGKKS
jgi:predicted ABC-type sugar transport system permease subunit